MDVADLMAAIKARDIGRVQEMLDEDPELVHAHSSTGESAVLTAVYYGAGEIRDFLLSRGAVLDLQEAAAVGDQGRIQALLSAGEVAVDAYSADGFTALALSAYFGHLEAARILLAAGASVQARAHNRLDNTPLHAAAAGRHADLAALLLTAGAPVGEQDGAGWAPLHLAADNGDLSTATVLLQHGADVNQRGPGGNTPLAKAEQKGHAAVADLLRSRGAAL